MSEPRSTEGQTSQDPLDGAAVCETRTVRESKTLHGIDMEPSVFFGSDRQVDHQIVDVEVIEDDRDGYCDDVKITWEGEVTKTLPRRWDESNEPRTAAEEKQAKRAKWRGRALRAAATLIPLGIGLGVTMHAMNAIAGSMTVNGETVTTPSMLEVAPVIALIAGFVLFLKWAASGGIPPMMGVGR